MKISFVETTAFSQSLNEFFESDDSYRRFQNILLETPSAGDVIPGTGGLRKVRWIDSRRGKGTRGGIRVVYLLVPETRLVVFLRAYNKDKQDDLTDEQRRRLAVLAEAIRQEMLK